MKLSIIIPTLNEVDYLKNTITHLMRVAKDPEQIEVIIVDAGSTDGTLESIKHLSCTTFTQPAFIFKKFESLNFGLDKSKGDIVMFLDADTLLPEKFDNLLLSAMSNSKIVGGAFEFEFLKRDFSLWVIQMGNRLRYRVDQTYYGDQGVFCRKEVAMKIGGYPKVSLMESAYFCRELKKIGKLKLIRRSIRTSPRRFTDHGIWKVLWFDTRMWIRFLLRLDVNKFGRKYWKQEL